MEVDDEEERRIRFTFQPYQAVRVVTADCYSPPAALWIEPQVISEVFDSEWIDQLQRACSRVDETANFMERARHFLVPLQDEFLEIVAWDVKWSRLDE